MKKLFFAIIALYWLIYFPTNAQTGIFYSTDKEISNSLINNIYQDKRNYVWIATEDGLNKFDGVKFTVYKNNPENQSTLKNNYVRCLFEDSKNRFWIGCIDGLSLFDRTTNKFSEIKLYSAGKIIHPHITSIIESTDGAIWISTSGEGVLKMSSRKDSIFFEADTRLNARLPSLHLMFIFQDSYQQFWIGSENHGLCMYDNKTGSFHLFDVKKNNIGNNQISTITEDSQGNIFVGASSGGFFKLNKETWRFDIIPYIASMQLPINSLLIDNQKQLLIGTDGFGLKKYNYTLNKIEDYPINSSIFDFSKVKVHSILQDRAGNLWIGLFQKGVFLLRNNPYKFNYLGNKYHNQNLIGSSCITAIYKDKNNTLWIGTDNDGLYELDKNKQTRHFSHSNSPNSVSGTIMSILETSNGEMWLGSFLHGLSLFNKNTGTCTYFNEKPANLANSTFDNKINCMITDENSNIWIGTHGGGLYVFDTKTHKYIKHYEFPTITNNWINCIYKDAQGLIWVGTHKGYSIIDRSKNRIYNYTENKKVVPSRIIYSITQDRKGNIWLGTTEGLSRYDKKKNIAKIFTTKDGLSENVICGIVEDAIGNMWVSTHSGLSKYNVKNNTFTNYYSSDGLQGNEFSKGAFFRTQSDEIFFGGISGITSFYPSQIEDVKTSFKLYITALNIGDREIFNGENKKKSNRFISDLDTIFLDYKDNIFNLEFSTFNFGVAEQIRYRYKMEGLNKAWINTSPGLNRIHFTNIKYGTYKLKVIASLRDVDSEVKETVIIISPPWYLSRLSIIVYFLLGFLLIYGVAKYTLDRIRYRHEMIVRQHKEQLNEAKLQYFINISHEIRTPMSLIISPLEKLIPGEKDPQKQYLYLVMQRNAKRILRLINQLMDVRKIEKGQMVLSYRETDIVGFIDDLMQTFEYTAKKRNINFQFIHQEPKLNVWIDVSNFDKVMMNVLSNAFKFTPENGKITVHLNTGTDLSSPNEFLQHYFEIVVSDSGIGIEEANLENIFNRFYQEENSYTKSQTGTGIGLHLSRSLVELLQGIIFARNKDNESGCEFVIRLPLGNKHLNKEEVALEQIKEVTPIEKLTPEDTTDENIILDDTKTEDEKIKSKTKYKVVIVEDDNEIREYLKKELSQIVRVKEFQNGKEALSYILNEKPDLVLSDIMMPEMDGTNLCKRIKSNSNVNHIPVILLTAKSTDIDKTEGFESGADAYVVKPFNIDLLITQIIGLIKNRQRVDVKPLEEESNKALITPLPLKSSDQILLEKVLKLINENISNSDLNVEFLSNNIGMSRVHMYRKIKQLTNQSTHDFIKTIRMRKAAELFSGKKINISEVAYALGFSNLSHFSNSFKDFYGISPKEYAEKHRIETEE